MLLLKIKQLLYFMDLQFNFKNFKNFIKNLVFNKTIDVYLIN